MFRSCTLGAVSGLILVVACVGSDPDPVPATTTLDAGTSSGGQTSGGQTSSGATTSSSGVGADTCKPNETSCGGSCSDTKSDAKNCGACGRDCGAGTCAGGSCVPYATATALTKVFSLAAVPTGVVIGRTNEVSLCTADEGCTDLTLKSLKKGTYGSERVTVAASANAIYIGYRLPVQDAWRVEQCAFTGCASDDSGTIEQSTQSIHIGAITVAPTLVAWSRGGQKGNYIKNCDPASCKGTLQTTRSETATLWSTDTQRELDHPTLNLSVGAKSVLWGTGGLYGESTKNLRYCTLGFLCSDGTELAAAGKVTAMAYYDGKHYVAVETNAASTIVAYNDADPSQSRTVVSDAVGVSALAVSETGLYWTNAKTGEVLRCSNLAACPANERIATKQSGALAITVGPRYVYWALPDRVMQVAK